MNAFRIRLAALIRKEIRQIARDSSSVLIGLVLPMILILLFGYGLSLDVKNVPIAVVVEEPSPLTRDILAGLAGSPYYSPRQASSMAEAVPLLDSREVDAILRIPSDFAARLHTGSGQAQLLLHGTDASSATLIRGYVQAALNLWTEKQLARAGTRNHGGAAILESRMWFNAANTSTWYLVPGLMVIILTLVGAFLTAMIMAREWERGTLESLFVTPARTAEILLAKLIPPFFIGMGGFFLCLAAARLLFNVPLHGSFWALLLCTMIYLLVALEMGLLISALTRNQFLAGQVTIIVSCLPAVMLSGFLFDLRNVPVVIRAVGQLLPATYYMQLLKTLFLAGDDWAMLFRNCAILLMYVAILLRLTLRTSRKRLD